MTELLDEDVDDAVLIAVSWLKGLQPAGQVAAARREGDPLPFILVNYIDGIEDVDCGEVDDVVSVHTLVAKGNGDASTVQAGRVQADKTHRRMLLLARHLEDVALPGGRIATIDFVKVASRPQWQPYADDQILRKVGRYQIGLSYARI